MIKKILVSFFLIELFIACSIYLVWQANGTPVHTIEIGAPFLAFMNNCSRELNDFAIEIPNIPSIPALEDTNGFMLVINALVTFFNGVINVLNVIVTLLNTIIQVIQFIFIVLKNLITFKDTLVSA